jgi:uridylate kinase
MVMIMARKIKEVRDLGVEIAVVIGGGNLWRGEEAANGGMDRVKADNAGMLATVINGLVLGDALEQAGVPARVQSAVNMMEIAEVYLRDKAMRHMQKGRVLILTAGTGVPYVTTDTGASLRALELQCDVILKATKVDGVFERDPHVDMTARRYRTLNLNDAINMNEIRVIDKAALSMCNKNNMPILVFKIFSDTNLLAAIRGEGVGTFMDNNVITQLV